MKNQNFEESPKFTINPADSESCLDIEHDIRPQITGSRKSSVDIEMNNINETKDTKSKITSNVNNMSFDHDTQTPRIQKGTQEEISNEKYHTQQKLCYDQDVSFVQPMDIKVSDDLHEGGIKSKVNAIDEKSEVSATDTTIDGELKMPQFDQYELQKLSVLRTWLIFLVFCFIFEEFALEIPSFPLLSGTTKTYIGTLLMLIMIMILLIIHSFQNSMNSIYIVSLLMQIAFIMCDMKTTHHFSTKENHIVVRNTCSGRLLLMSLETSHLTALACKHNWQKYAVINSVNITMFSVLIFIQFDFAVCGFWELAQLSSMYISGIMSLVIYSYLIQVASDTDKNRLEDEREEKEVFKTVASNSVEGVMIITQGRITYFNQILNEAFSSVFGVNNFSGLVLNSKIYSDYSKLDQRIFSNIESQKRAISNKQAEVSIAGNKASYSLREIFDMDASVLNQMTFSFVTEQENLSRFKIEKIAIKSGSKNFSFILNFKVLQKGQKEILSLLTSNLAHQMKNPLSSIMNQSRIIERICQHFIKKFDPSTLEKGVYQNIADFNNSIQQVNKNFVNMSNQLKFNIEDMLTYGQLKTQMFVKNCQDIDIRASITEVVEMQQSNQKKVQIQTHFYGFQSNKNPNDEITNFQDANMMVNIDKVRLQQVMSNLLVILLKNNTDVSTIHIMTQLIRGNQSSDMIQDVANDFIQFKVESDEEVKSRNTIKNLFKQDKLNRNKIVISVVHSGKGFSSSRQANMFKSFEKEIDGPNSQDLSMIKKLVSSFEGKLFMMSQKNIGSQFAFSMILDSKKNQIDSLVTSANQQKLYDLNLPTEESNVVEIPQIETTWNLKNNAKEDGNDHQAFRYPADLSNVDSAQQISQGSSSSSFKSEYERLGKILIVDDEQYNLDVMKVFFEILGMEKISERVTFCQDGEQSTKIITDSISNGNPFEYTLILTDINMPFVNGFQATKNMRNLWLDQNIQRREQPIIYGITAQYDKTFIENAKLSGMDQVYAKPIEIDDIAMMLYKMGFITDITEFKKQKEQS